MKSKNLLKFIFIFIATASCSSLPRNINIKDSANEIQIDKTEFGNAIKLTGQSDEEFITYACGGGSGHENGWSTFKKLGLAIYTVSYTPDRKDGYKNGIVRDIGIFDTTNLKVRKSKQEAIYYNQDYYPISKLNLEIVYGKPNKIKIKDSVQYIFYNERQMTFAFNKQNNQFIKLYLNNKK